MEKLIIVLALGVIIALCLSLYSFVWITINKKYCDEDRRFIELAEEFSDLKGKLLNAKSTINKLVSELGYEFVGFSNELRKKEIKQKEIYCVIDEDTISKVILDALVGKKK